MIRLIIVLIIIYGSLSISAQMTPSDLFSEFKKGNYVWSKNPEHLDLGYRLPNDTKPVRYDLELTTYIHLDNEEPEEGEEVAKKFTFDGHVKIQIQVVEPTQRITLHAWGLTVTEAHLRDFESGEVIQEWTKDQVDYNEKFTFVMFPTETELPKDKQYVIDITYHGVLIDTLGFHKTHYVDKDGRKHWLAATQFQPVLARTAWPCYDEPWIRAPIKLSMIHSKKNIATSNMPIESNVELDDEMVKTTFYDTPKMQTYTMAFVVHELPYIESHGEVPIRIFGRKEMINNGEADFALRFKVKILNWLGEYLGVPFSKNHVKLDAIAVPNFFGGGQENWGLILYTERLLYFNEKTQSSYVKQVCSEAIAHELSHQYFGNLVSPAWWGWFWLNEGFATLFSTRANAATHPEFNSVDNFQIREFVRAMTFESTGRSRPMNVDVEEPIPIVMLNDIVSYAKGASFLRMLSTVLTEPVWKKGMHYYMTNMENQGATPEDLAFSLQQAVNESSIDIGVSVQDIIDSWANNAGVPVLHVTLDEEKQELTFTQERYVNSPDIEIRYPNDKDEWLIPINFITASQPNLTTTVPEFWLKTKELKRPWTSGSDTDWLLVNVDATGYYRVSYDQTLWERMIQKLNSDSFNEIPLYSRAQMLDDSFSFGSSGLMDYVTVLKLVRYLSRETHHVPWTMADTGFRQLSQRLTDSDAFELFNRFISELVAPLYQHLGGKDRGDTETNGPKAARRIALYWACKTGDTNCLEEAKHRLNLTYYDHDASIEPDLDGILQCAALRQVSQEQFELMFLRMQKTESTSERKNLLLTLACSTDSNQQKWFLNTTIMTEIGAPRYEFEGDERTLIVSSVSSNDRSGLINSIEFLTENYDDVKKFYPENAINILAKDIVQYVSANDTMTKFTEFLIKGQRSGDLTSEELNDIKAVAEMNYVWVEKNQDEIHDYLKALYNGAPKFNVALGLLVLGALVAVLFK